MALITYDSLVNKPELFLGFFGVSVEVFDELMVFVELNYPNFNVERRKDRVNAVGAQEPHFISMHSLSNPLPCLSLPSG